MDDLDRKTQSSNARLSSIGNLFSRAWQVYKSRFWTLVGIMAVPVLIWFLMGVIGLAFPSLGRVSPVFMILFAVLAVVIGVILAFWPQAALIYAVKERDRQIGVKDSFAKAWHIISSFIWVSALTSLVVAGGFLLLIIPGIIFSVWFLFAAYILIEEGVKGSTALSKSKELVKGRWWSIFGRMALLGLVVGVIGFIIALIPIVGQLIVNLLITPFSVVFLYLLYEDLKRVKRKAPQAEDQEQPSSQKGISSKVIISLAILGLIALIGIPTAVTKFALSGAREKAKDALITSEMAQLRSEAELTFAEEGGYGDFACDYDSSTQNYCKEIKENGGEVTIHSGEEDYCAYTPLNEGSYYCVDSTGATGETDVDPSTVCTQENFKCPSELEF